MTVQKPLSNNTSSAMKNSEQTGPHRRPWIRTILFGVMIIVALLAALALILRDQFPTAAKEPEAPHFAEVVITDLIQEETYDGTLGSIEDDPVTTQLGGTVTEIAAPGDTVSQGETLFAIDNQPVVLLYGDLPAFRDITVGEETLTVSSPLSGMITWVAKPGTVAQQGDVLYRVNNQPVVVMYGNLPVYRDMAINASGVEAITVQNHLDGTITWAAEPGTIIQQGDVLYRVDDQPVVALYGDQPAYRNLYDTLSWKPSEEVLTAAQSQVTFATQALEQAEEAYKPYRNRPDGDLQKANYGSAWAAAQQNYNVAVQHLNFLTGSPPRLSGDDVRQLEQALVALDYDIYGSLVVDGIFTSETTQAVLAFQAAAGLIQDGIVDLGEVVFLPGPTQVLNVLAAPGDQAAGDVMSVSASDPARGADVLQLEEALVALGYDANDALVADGIFTSETTQAVLAFQSAAGLEQDGIVDLGEVVFLPGPAQVLDIIVAPGNPAAGAVVSIATGAPASGTDVLQLEKALVALGYDADGTLVADGIYAPETTRAVLAFQAAAGLETDGMINLGEVVFLPGAARITNPLAAKGSTIGAGSAVLGISLSEKVVHIDLAAQNQGALTVGDAVSVEMPDLTLVPATVAFVSQTAAQADNGQATFEVLIELDDPTVAEGLDEAPVDVIVVSDSVKNVMAVPVSALMALLEGGYAVEVDDGGGITHLVAVDVGFFGDNNLIEIASAELQPGDQVVVP